MFGLPLRDQLNRMAPAAAHARIGDLLDEMITKQNLIVAQLVANGTTGFTTATQGSFTVLTLEQRPT